MEEVATAASLQSRTVWHQEILYRLVSNAGLSGTSAQTHQAGSPY